MKKMIVGLFVVAGLIGCNTDPRATVQARVLESEFVYFKDSRTDLCFLSHKTRYDTTNVPCTPEVLKQVEFFSQPRQ